MNYQYLFYETISDAIKELIEKGFKEEFKIVTGGIADSKNGIIDERSIIRYIYRYEGTSDPSDESIIYAIETPNGLKGFLLTGYGFSAEDYTSELLRKMSLGSNEETPTKS